ncbi:hypothetical protein ACFVV7_36800 [Streptomyces globisporus]|uniref:hypothetical protein n=1 Tax=Streptomyces globisporus TaxID=1908 RepID=UPI0036DC97AE
MAEYLTAAMLPHGWSFTSYVARIIVECPRKGTHVVSVEAHADRQDEWVITSPTREALWEAEHVTHGPMTLLVAVDTGAAKSTFSRVEAALRFLSFQQSLPADDRSGHRAGPPSA